jgi:acyl carrier protein
VTRAQIRTKLEQIVKRSDGPSHSAPQEDAFALFGQKGVFDSVSALQLVFDVEEQFGIVVEDEEIGPDNFHSLDALTDYIQRKVSKR